MNRRGICNRIERIISLFIPKRVMKAEIYYLAPNQRLFGKNIIVTGGAYGIGYAMAKKFCSEGANVLIAGRDEDALQRVSRELSCYYLYLDVTKVESFQDFMEKADELLGGVNVLVNNAGISLHEGNIGNVTVDSFDKQINTNLRGGYFLCKEFLKDIKKRANGSVLFVSSERGRYADDLPYGITKAAVNSLVKGLAVISRGNHIRVNAVAPGVTATKLTGKSEDNIYAPKYAIGRIYLPDEIAEVSCFLVSDASNCISGQIIYCDNGFSINSYKK